MAKTKNTSTAPTSGQGKGATKRVTSAEHEARRRSKKAAQNANARAAAAHKLKTGGTFTEGIRQDKHQERLERELRQSEYRQQQLIKQELRLIGQASLAVDQQALTRLQRGSIADKMARAIIGQFPTATPRWELGTKITRTQVAIELAKLEMSEIELDHEESIELGIRSAQSALFKAFHILDKAQKQQVQSS